MAESGALPLLEQEGRSGVAGIRSPARSGVGSSGLKASWRTIQLTMVSSNSPMNPRPSARYAPPHGRNDPHGRTPRAWRDRRAFRKGSSVITPLSLLIVDQAVGLPP